MTDKLNIIETIAKDAKFSTFSRLLGTSGADSVFTPAGKFTVFAPTNDAFGKIPEATMNEFLNEKDQTKLKSLLSYHILPGSWSSANLGTTPVRKSVTGQNVAFSSSNGLMVNDSLVQAGNIEATDGVIHQIDTVLTQPPFGAAIAASANQSAPSSVPTAVPEGVPTAAATAPGKSIL